MSMKKLFCAMAGIVAVASAVADTPLWLRYPAISPDGSTIAFCYQGDIFTVPSSGGAAKLIPLMTICRYGVPMAGQ